jgi:putative colanic acid biosynthesis UDP-glucose lipid carrier transferase
MIDNAAISTHNLPLPNLSVVGRRGRLRDQIDRKRYFFLAKRLFDILFSLAFILFVLSWLVPIIMVLIRLSSKGPVFFLQKRIGRGGKAFTCYKFRTMVVNHDADTKQACEYDARITRFGWFLRKSNIDEFPQFLNVLQGSMSLVGPRPHMYADCHNFAALMPGYKFRNFVKPGLTGMAQVKGYHGPTPSRNSILMRYHWDSYYIRNIGWVLDIKIIFGTIAQRLFAIGKFAMEKAGLRKPYLPEDLAA